MCRYLFFVLVGEHSQFPLHVLAHDARAKYRHCRLARHLRGRTDTLEQIHVERVDAYLLEIYVLLCTARQQVPFVSVRDLSLARGAPLLPRDLPHIRVALALCHHGAGQIEFGVFVGLDQNGARHLGHPRIVARGLWDEGVQYEIEREGGEWGKIIIGLEGMGSDTVNK